MHHVLCLLTWEEVLQTQIWTEIWRQKPSFSDQCTRGNCARTGLRPTSAGSETSANMPTDLKNSARIITSTLWSKPSSQMISTSLKIVAHSTGKSFVCMAKGAISDMNLEALRKFIVTSICATCLPWSILKRTSCRTVRTPKTLTSTWMTTRHVRSLRLTHSMETALLNRVTRHSTLKGALKNSLRLSPSTQMKVTYLKNVCK